MGTLIRNCPHCHAGKISFQSFAEHQDPNSVNPRVFITAFYCGGCHGGYFAKIAHMAGHTPHPHPGDIEKSQTLAILAEYPKPSAIKAPQYLPENIQTFFIQAAHNLSSGNLDASAMMSRKVLEVAVKTLNPDGSGKLYKRIEDLHTSGKITDDLKDWAHIIRDDGNEATHDEEPVNQKFADELLAFAELFLMYTFTMPGMVKAKKGESE